MASPARQPSSRSPFDAEPGGDAALQGEDRRPLRQPDIRELRPASSAGWIDQGGVAVPGRLGHGDGLEASARRRAPDRGSCGGSQSSASPRDVSPLGPDRRRDQVDRAARSGLGIGLQGDDGPGTGLVGGEDRRATRSDMPTGRAPASLR